jgi:NDP-sugar pyrophosphorylase family protein
MPEENGTYRSAATQRPAQAWAVSLRAVVVLSGGVRANELVAGLGRSLLDLPVSPDATLLSRWRDQCEALGTVVGGATNTVPLALRAIVSKPGALPNSVPSAGHVNVSVEYDRVELRGTGGLLRDLAEDYADDDALLVVHGNQALVRPLTEVFQSLASVDADVVLLAEPDGSSSGVHLMRCGALRDVRAKGYIDLKEQALPALSASHRVRVVRGASPTGLRIRTLEQYIRALRALTTGDILDRPDPYAEEWARTFSLVQQGASVDPRATIHDSVVMRGAVVGPGAVVVRSLVCEGARVPARAAIFDTVIPGEARLAGAGAGGGA